MVSKTAKKWQNLKKKRLFLERSLKSLSRNCPKLFLSPLPIFALSYLVWPGMTPPQPTHRLGSHLCWQQQSSPIQFFTPIFRKYRDEWGTRHNISCKVRFSVCSLSEAVLLSFLVNLRFYQSFNLPFQWFADLRLSEKTEQ